MKYICRLFAENPNGSCYNKNDRDKCKHGEPHILMGGVVCTSTILNRRCRCVPCDLEYYMKKIIKEHEEKK
jgi:hypothetical protein